MGPPENCCGPISAGYFFAFFPATGRTTSQTAGDILVYKLVRGASLDEFTASVPPGLEPDVLFFPMTGWHTRIQRSQQLARALAASGHRCIYINPHLGCEHLRPYLADRHSWISVLLPRILEFHIHLPREHVLHRRLLSADESRRVLAAVGELVAVLRIPSAVQLVSFPIWLDAAKWLRDLFGFPIVYDCHDYLGGFENVAPEIIHKEAELFEACDLVTFSARSLMESTIAAFSCVRTKAALVRNAADASHFRSQAQQPGVVADPAKVIGYAGSLDHWFDVEAVRHAARERPDWKFLLVGRIEDPRITTLRDCPNVEFAGEVPYAELPKYVATFRVAMIPFLRNRLTLAANPIKLYDYFSLGLPVVSTRLPEVKLYWDLVYLADNPSDFSAQIARAIKESDPSLRERRMTVAQGESWLCRAKEWLGVFDRQVRAVRQDKA